MSYPILYSFRRCPYAIRARMALAYSNITVELREIVLRNRPEALYKISPKGTVPVLYIDEQTILEESLDIMFWSLKRSDTDLYNSDNIDLQTELIKENDEDFKIWLDRYKYFDRYPDESRKYYRSNCEKYLKKIEAMLNDREYLFNNSISLADIAIFPFIRQFAHIDRIWLDKTYANLSKWMDSMIEHPLFKSVMFKYDEYSKGQESYITNFNYYKHNEGV